MQKDALPLNNPTESPTIPDDPKLSLKIQKFQNYQNNLKRSQITPNNAKRSQKILIDPKRS